MSFFYLLTAIICGAYVLLMLSYLYGWKMTSIQAVKPETLNLKPETRVSVIIPARNEEFTILNCLASISKQNYPSELYEVIVVNDHSTDRTAAITEACKYPNVKVIHLPEDKHGKKSALAEGIKNAKGTLIVSTDADCTMNVQWLASIAAFYHAHKPKMIVAPVLLREEAGFQQKMQSQEMTVLTACACAAIRLGDPVLCSGANLIYEREAFHAVHGFEGVDETATGDDIFLMLKIQKRFSGEIRYLKSYEAAVFTSPEISSRLALRQRKRWASKSFHYGKSHITGIAMLVFSTNFLILILGILSVINLKFVFALAIVFLGKCLVDFMLLSAASSFFRKKTDPLVFMLASIAYPVYVSLMGLIAPFTRYTWKSRTS